MVTSFSFVGNLGEQFRTVPDKPCHIYSYLQLLCYMQTKTSILLRTRFGFMSECLRDPSQAFGFSVVGM